MELTINCYAPGVETGRKGMQKEWNAKLFTSVECIVALGSLSSVLVHLSVALTIFV